MKVLIFGRGGLSRAISLVLGQHDVDEISEANVDVRDFLRVVAAVKEYEPDAVINCSGLSDRIIGVTVQDVIDVNLVGAINVSLAANAPCILIASTAGMEASPHHPWYGPAKAGVIAHVRSRALAGQPIWALSPNRMDTPMREADWPDEDRGTRLNPLDVAYVVEDILTGKYASGANVVVRKVGLTDRVDVYEEPVVKLPGLL